MTTVKVTRKKPVETVPEKCEDPEPSPGLKNPVLMLSRADENVSPVSSESIECCEEREEDFDLNNVQVIDDLR